MVICWEQTSASVSPEPVLLPACRAYRVSASCLPQGSGEQGASGRACGLIANKTGRRGGNPDWKPCYILLGFRRREMWGPPSQGAPAKQCILNVSQIAKLFHCF